MPQKQLPLFSGPASGASDELPLEGTPAASMQLEHDRPERISAQTSPQAAILAWEAHLKDKRRSEHTIKAFTGDLKLLIQYLGPARNTVDQITTRDLNTWLQSQRTGGLSPKTYARRVTSIKSFFRWLVETGVLAGDPAAPVIQHTVLSPLPQVLSEAEIQSILIAAQAMRSGERPDTRPYLLFTLLLQTGIKKGECVKLKRNHVDLSDPEAPVLWVRYADPRYRFKERKLSLTPHWVGIYQEYVSQYPAEDLLFPWSARRLEYLLEDIGQAAGLTKHLSFDMCRWTCAVRDARAGMEPDRIRQKLGLSKIQWREIGMKLKKLTEPAL